MINAKHSNHIVETAVVRPTPESRCHIHALSMMYIRLLCS